MSHIAVERNRRRIMNEHLKVLRSLTPFFYIKRGDQASIIGGVIEFINELHQLLRSLEAKKRRKSLQPRATQGERSQELEACCNSPFADVEAKISSSHIHLRTISRRVPGQIVRMIHILETLSLEILHLNISTMEDTTLYSFVLKIGFDCRVSLEELVGEVHRSFIGEGHAQPQV